MNGMIDIKGSSNTNTGQESFEDIIDEHYCDISHIQMKVMVIA